MPNGCDRVLSNFQWVCHINQTRRHSTFWTTFQRQCWSEDVRCKQCYVVWLFFSVWLQLWLEQLRKLGPVGGEFRIKALKVKKEWLFLFCFLFGLTGLHTTYIVYSFLFNAYTLFPWSGELVATILFLGFCCKLANYLFFGKPGVRWVRLLIAGRLSGSRSLCVFLNQLTCSDCSFVEQ